MPAGQVPTGPAPEVGVDAQDTKGQLVSRTELAKILGYAPGSISRLQDDGLPIAVHGGRGVESKYDTAAVVRWLIDRERAKLGLAGAVSLEQERARKERAQAVIAEQKIAEHEGKVIRTDAVERVWGKHVARVKTKLENLVVSLGHKLHRAALTDGVTGVDAVLETAVLDVLRELAGEEGSA